MSLAPQNRVVMRTYHAVNPTCVACDTVELTEPLCLPDVKLLTAQCTDQCVVIACDDPHAESMCNGGSEHTHCDLVCDERLNCTDCNALDDFVVSTLDICP